MNAKNKKAESRSDQDRRATELPWPLSMETVEDSKYQLLPPLSPAEYEALKKDIDENGLDDPVVFDEDGNVLDGHNRLRACLELEKTDFPCKIKRGLQSDQDKKNWVRGRNCRRRHLTHEQKRTLCVAQLKETPDLSDTNIGEIVAVDHKTVGKYRRELEDLGTIETVEERKSKNGAVRKSPKRQATTPKPAPKPVEETAPVVVTVTEDELADDIADVAVGEPDVTELAHDDCLLLAASPSDLRRHLEPQSLRGIICDNPLKPGRGRKPKKPVMPPETLQHYKDVAKLAA